MNLAFAVQYIAYATSVKFEMDVSGHVLAGEPDAQISAMAAEADVDPWVILTRRRGEGLFGRALGSISYQGLCEARKPRSARTYASFAVRFK